jgi:hypothetical protein
MTDFKTLLNNALSVTGESSEAASRDLIRRTEAAIGATALVPVLSNLRTLACLNPEDRWLDRLFQRLAASPLAANACQLARSGLVDESPILAVYVACLNFATRGYEAGRSELSTLIASFEANGKAAVLPRSVRNGIRSLPSDEELGREWPTPAIPLKLEGRIQPQSAGETAFFTISDARYLAAFGEIFIKSLAEHYPSPTVHMALVNPEPTSLGLLRVWADRHNVGITYSFEECSGDMSSFCINQRNILLAKVIASLSSISPRLRQIVLTDVDCIFRDGLSKLLDEAAGSDVGVVSGQRRRGYFLPWSRVDGNFVCVSTNDAGRKFANALSGLTSLRFDPSMDQVFQDQAILFGMVEGGFRNDVRVRILNDAGDVRGAYWQASGYDGDLDSKLAKLLGPQEAQVPERLAKQGGLPC